MGIKSKPPSSAAAACADLRAAYHDCFNRWYSEKFSKGLWDKEECVVEWDKYRACLAQHIEDKNLSRLLLEAEAAIYLTRDDDMERGESAASGKRREHALEKLMEEQEVIRALQCFMMQVLLMCLCKLWLVAATGKKGIEDSS